MHFVSYYQVEKGGVVQFAYTSFPHWPVQYQEGKFPPAGHRAPSALGVDAGAGAHLRALPVLRLRPDARRGFNPPPALSTWHGGGGDGPSGSATRARRVHGAPRRALTAPLTPDKGALSLVRVPSCLVTARAGSRGRAVSLITVRAGSRGRSVSLITARAGSGGRSVSLITARAGSGGRAVSLVTARAGSGGRSVSLITARAGSGGRAVSLVTARAGSGGRSVSLITARAGSGGRAVSLITARAGSRGGAVSLIAARAGSREGSVSLIAARAGSRGGSVSLITACAGSRGRAPGSIRRRHSLTRSSLPGRWWY